MKRVGTILKRKNTKINMLSLYVTPEGIEPPPREPESLVLSIKLRSHKIGVLVASTGIEPVFGV